MHAFSIETWLRVALAALVLVLPGTALYMVASRASGCRAGLRSALLPGIGLGLAFWPLLLLYLTLAGLRLTPWLAWSLLVLALVVTLVLTVNNQSGLGEAQPGLIVYLVLSGMALLALVFRLGDIDGLAVPLFGDSLHHTMIASIITDTGRVPGGYQPFVPVDTFTYHFGFHTLTAVLAMLTGAPAPEAVLIMGQVLNVASLLMVYLLGRTLFSSQLAGLAAALITGFVSVMPAYYVNWGRYTQLAGLVLLPVVMVFTLRILRREARAYEVGLAAFCVAGLVVVHYRILIFYGLFLIALAVWFGLSHRRERDLLLTALGRVSLAVVAGLVLTAPWLWNLYINYFEGLARRLSTVTAEYISSYNSLENLRVYAGRVLPALGLLGLLVALARVKEEVRSKNEEYTGPPLGRIPSGAASVAEPDSSSFFILPSSFSALVVATWTALMVGSLWVVPGAIGSYTVAITVYIPLSLLGGYAFGLLLQIVALRLKVPALRLALALLVAAPLAALLMGSWHVADVARYSYVHEADLRAFDWIEANTPPDAKFLISSEISYAGRGVTASDAGMWLPLLAGRNVSPPTLAAWTERPLDPEFFTNTRILAAYTQPAGDPEVSRWAGEGLIPEPLPPGDPRVLALMRQLGITHVYSGTPSVVPGGTAKPRLDLAGMQQDTCHYRPIYGPEGGVYVFEVVYDC